LNVELLIIGPARVRIAAGWDELLAESGVQDFCPKQ